MLCVSAMAQTVTLTFTGRDAASQYVQLDRVTVTDQTKGWTETLLWPDTTLPMQNGTGIADYTHNDGFSLSQNNPNPFNGTTDVNLTVADAGAVTLEIVDVNGRIVETVHAPSLPNGIQQFRVTLSAAGTYMMTARQNGKMSSIKMVNNGGGKDSRIEFVGTVQSITFVLKSTTPHPFDLGDMMEYVGFATINGVEYESDRISQAQDSSQTFMLRFEVGPPEVTTQNVTDITATAATLNGEVTDDHNVNVTERGFCYGTSPSPSLNGSYVIVGNGTGSFSSGLAELTPATTYYVRAYATNMMGTAYGNEVCFTTTISLPEGDAQPCPGNETLTDIDGNVYNTVQIGQQCWMKENLRTTHYADHTEILAGSTTSSTVPYRYTPNNDEANVPTCGYLYNWAAVMHGTLSSDANPSEVQGICPNGWHVPSDAEWTQLTSYVGSQSSYVCGDDSRYIAKALTTATGWNSDGGDCTVGNDPSANNATGFSAFPAGYYGGEYGNFGSATNFWCTTEQDGYYAYTRLIWYDFDRVYRNFYYKDLGFSVRCLRD